MKTINLGFEGPDYGAITAAPEPEESKTKTHYPSMYIHDAPKELMNLPDEGEAVIKFRVVGKSMSKRSGKEADVGCELEIISITPRNMPETMGDEKESGAEDAMDRYFEDEE